MTHLDKSETALTLLAREKRPTLTTFDSRIDRVIKLLKKVVESNDHKGVHRDCVCDHCNAYHEIDGIFKAISRDNRIEKINSIKAGIKRLLRR
jgi:hypothetical protein